VNVSGLVLRPLAAGDEHELLRIHRTPEVRRWWDEPDAGFPFSDEPESTRLTIELEGAVVGLVQFYEEPTPKYRHAAVDLFLDPALHGRGLGTEVLRRVVRHLIEERGHHRVTIDPAVTNVAAITAYERVGFRPVGVMRRYERDVDGAGWHDGLLMELIAEDQLRTYAGAMSDPGEMARHFLELHHSERPLLLPNPWDLGSAKVLASLGFKALATTSGGFAASLGRADGAVSREEALAHARAVTEASGLPVNGDFENGFGDEPSAVAETIERALSAGIAGCSIEDWSGSAIYERELARERVTAAAEVAHGGPVRLVLTARAENHIRGRDDLADTIARLQAYQQAGADVLYAPGLRNMQDIRAVLDSIEQPLNVLAMPGVPRIGELAEAGVSRVSVGGAFATTAYAALVQAASELRDEGTYGYLEAARAGSTALRTAFAAPGA
jgi:2-methylisocitrate lyase-like PEP mutase family enzyme/RimJ/RimL family protein N-acetyltransferase